MSKFFILEQLEKKRLEKETGHLIRICVKIKQNHAFKKPRPPVEKPGRI